MACVNISGHLFPESILNATEDEVRAIFAGLSDGFFLWEWWNSTLEQYLLLPHAEHVPGVLCVANPTEMLSPWSVNEFFSVLVTSYAITFLVGCAGNTIAVLGMLGDRKSRNATTLFLVSLSAADLLLLVVCAPLETLQYFVIHWDEAGTVCKLIKYAEVLSAMASVLNLTAVSLERYNQS